MIFVCWGGIASSALAPILEALSSVALLRCSLIILTSLVMMFSLRARSL
jgi:hypothetical protein